MSSPAQASAKWRSETSVLLDHATLTEEDLAWLGKASDVTAWAVRTPVGFWSRLPGLERLDLQGGSGADVGFVTGCLRLRWLQVNQIRGVQDLEALVALPNLEFLLLYGLPRVSAIPSLADLTNLRFALVGSMKGLRGLDGLLDAPNLEELTLVRAVGLDRNDAERIANHRSIRAFDWFAEDVPDRTWTPVVARIAKPKPTVNVRTWRLPD